MWPILLAIAAGLCWGVGEVCTKLVLRTGQVGPITAVAVRALVDLPMLWLAYALLVAWKKTEPTTWPSMDAPTMWKLILGSGVTAGGFGLIFFYSSLKLADVSLVKPIAFTIAPATAVLLGWLVLGEVMTVRKAIGVGLILLGVVLLASSRPATAKPIGEPRVVMEAEGK